MPAITTAKKAKTKNKKKITKLSLWQKIKRDKFLLLIFVPGALYFLIFKLVPMFGVTMAFQKYDIRKSFFGSEFVGLYQFNIFFHSPMFGRLLKNTLLLSLYGWIFGFPLPVIFALALNEFRLVHLKKLTQTISYLPHFISTVVIAGMVTEFCSPSGGFISKAIRVICGMNENPYLLGEAGNFRTIYTITTMWMGLGWGAIIYLSALSGVDPQLYEAATIDGATRMQRIWHITLPALLPTITIMLITSLGSIMNSGFDIIYLLQNDLNLSTSEVISTFVYKQGFFGHGSNVIPNYSYSTAVNLFQSVINMILVIIANNISRKLSETSLW